MSAHISNARAQHQLTNTFEHFGDIATAHGLSGSLDGANLLELGRLAARNSNGRYFDLWAGFLGLQRKTIFEQLGMVKVGQAISWFLKSLKIDWLFFFLFEGDNSFKARILKHIKGFSHTKDFEYNGFTPRFHE